MVRKGLCEARSFHQALGGVGHQPFAACAVDRDLAGFQKQRRGQRGDAGQADEIDAALHAGEHIFDAGEIDEAAFCLFPSNL